jgi:acyl dehydratase
VRNDGACFGLAIAKKPDEAVGSNRGRRDGTVDPASEVAGEAISATQHVKGTCDMSSESMTLGNIRQFLGKELGASSWEQIDQQRINAFAECTGDHQWIHVDLERAKRESPYGTTVAHGYLLLSMIAPTSFEVFVKPARIAAALNYGIDRVRFIAPVKAGSRIRNRIKLLAAEDKGNGRMLITTENTLEIEGEAKPALIAQALTMAVG